MAKFINLSERGSDLFFVFLNFSLEFFISIFCSIRSPQKGAPPQPPRSLAWPAPLMTLSFFSSVIKCWFHSILQWKFSLFGENSYVFMPHAENQIENKIFQSKVASRRVAVPWEFSVSSRYAIYPHIHKSIYICTFGIVWVPRIGFIVTSSNLRK